MKLQALRNECDSVVSDLREKTSIAEAHLHKSAESNRRLTRQVRIHWPILSSTFPSHNSFILHCHSHLLFRVLTGIGLSIEED